MLDDYKNALKSLPRGVKEAEINTETLDETSISIKDGEITDIQASMRTVLFARVTGEKTGYAYTEDLSESAATVFQRAYENSLLSERDFPDTLLSSNFYDESLETPAEDSPVVLRKKIRELFSEIIGKAETINSLHLTLSARNVGQQVMNSHGLNLRYTRPLYLLRAIASAPENDKVHSTSYIRTAKSIDKFCTDEFRNYLDTGLKTQFDSADSFKSGEYKAVLSNSVMYNIFVTAWQIFSGKKVMEGSSPLCGQAGRQIASEVLNIYDKPSVSYSGFDVYFDCEGTYCREASLVKDGILTGCMHNIATSTALNVENTGNAGRRALLSGNIATDILVIPRNFIVQPGNSSSKELLEHMGDGVYITSSSDVFHTVNIASGDFSIPCRGMLVQGGKTTKSLKSLTISGNLIDLFNNVQEVGSDLYMGVMDSLENYGIGGCSMRVDKLIVSGE